MNTWGWGTPPMLEKGTVGADGLGGPFHLYRSSFEPRAKLSDGTGVLNFTRISGKAEVWMDGVLLAKKDDFTPTKLVVRLPVGKGVRQLNVIIEGEGDKPAGIEGRVVVEAAK